jgi:serine/threonine protein kinase
LTEFQPEVFGRYHLLDRIGVGGMAEVFLAKQYGESGFEKLLVVKRIHGHLSHESEFVNLFVDEARISVRLQHPNIVQVFDFGRVEDHYYIAMEYVEGRDLRRLLARLSEQRRLLPPELSAFVVHEACRGLDFAHKLEDRQGRPLGIVHRDIAHSNLLLSYNGELKVTDFGVAKARDRIRSTEGRLLLGRAEYMSPEQASGIAVDARSDVFSLGVVFWEMLTGRRLFKAESKVASLELVRSADPAPPSSLNPGIPFHLERIAMKALARAPEDRFADARAFQVELAGFLHPATTDSLREDLGAFMKLHFEDDLAADRRRLDINSGSPPALPFPRADPSPTPAMPVARPAPSHPRTRLLLLLALPFLGGGALLAWRALVPHLAVTVPAPESEAAAGLAALEILTDPPVSCRFELDGAPAGMGTRLRRDGLPADREIVLRVEAEGYLPVEETLILEKGERLRMPLRHEASPPARGPGFQEIPRQRHVSAEAPIEAPRAPASADPPPEAIGDPAIHPEPDPGPGPDPLLPAASVELAPEPPRALPEPEPPAPEPSARPKTGTLFVYVNNGWAEVYVDGVKLKKTTPIEGLRLAEGTHVIKLRRPSGSRTWTRSVEVVAGQDHTLHFDLEG